MSAQERLAAAIWGRDLDPPEAHRIAGGILAADRHLAQDIEDGEALRLLGEAARNRGWSWTVRTDGPGYVARLSSSMGVEFEAWSACTHWDVFTEPHDCDIVPSVAAAVADCLKLASGALYPEGKV